MNHAQRVRAMETKVKRIGQRRRERRRDESIRTVTHDFRWLTAFAAGDEAGIEEWAPEDEGVDEPLTEAEVKGLIDFINGKTNTLT